MKKTFYVLMLLIFVCMSCSQDEAISTPEIDAANLSLSVKKNQKSLAKQPPTEFVNIARALNGNNGQGSIFLDPQSYDYYGYGIYALKDIVWGQICFGEPPFQFCFNFPTSGQIASFSADFGANDFWRQNPNGSVSVKLNSNQAYASVYDYGTGEYYEGTGTLNTKFTGAVEEFCYDPCLPDPCGFEWCVTNLTPDSGINANVGNGVANVTDSQGGSHQLRMSFVQNPGGGGRSLEFTLK